MAKKYDTYDDKINIFYQYLQQRLEIQDKMEKQEVLDDTYKSDNIFYQRDKRSIPSSI